MPVPQPTTFLTFWKTLNDVLRSRGQPEMLYGEARGWFADYRGWAA